MRAARMRGGRDLAGGAGFGAQPALAIRRLVSAIRRTERPVSRGTGADVARGRSHRRCAGRVRRGRTRLRLRRRVHSRNSGRGNRSLDDIGCLGGWLFGRLGDGDGPRGRFHPDCFRCGIRRDSRDLGGHRGVWRWIEWRLRPVESEQDARGRDQQHEEIHQKCHDRARDPASTQAMPAAVNRSAYAGSKSSMVRNSARKRAASAGAALF